MIRISWITGNADDFVNGSRDMAQRGVLAKHRLGPVLVRRHANRAIATLGGVIDIPVKLDGVDAQLSSYARFYYRAERRENRWKLSGFEAVYLRDELFPCRAGPVARHPAGRAHALPAVLSPAVLRAQP